MGYAVVLGEALVDLLDAECGGERVYRQAIGGAPLNVAVGVARLGGAVEFVGSLGDDALADRIRDFLVAAGVGTSGVVRVPAPSALAVATFAGAEPDFRFYGEPPSYALLDADALDVALVEDSAVLYCGSIALLHPAMLTAARLAWARAGGLRVFDPNVRLRLVPDEPARDALREIVAEFAASAHLVKLSAADGEILFPGRTAHEVATKLRSIGATIVVVTLGSRGAIVATGRRTVPVPAPQVTPVDATGAGDAVMAGLIAGLLAEGEPAGDAGWVARADFALRVAALVCESPGGATAMPTREQVAARFGAR
jgi:sugar/nucleoside kinase (ribokinase family)